MKKVVLVIVLTVLVQLGLYSQIIDNRLGNAFKEEMFFNREFLWQNKIAAVSGTVSIKRPNRPIDQRPDITVFHFNEVGLLQRIEKVTSVLSFVDSLTIEYSHTTTGAVSEKKEMRSSGIKTTQFIYDKEGNLVRLDFSNSSNISTEKGKLVPGPAVLINSENYTYSSDSSTVSRKNNYNNYGLLYSSNILSKNKLGYIITNREEMAMSGKATEKKYFYNDKGWVSSIETTDNMNGPVRREVFTYDEVGNLHKVELYEAEVLREEIDILYTETMLIEATLRTDLQTREIIITKYTYEFIK